jgi:hypothetical protein
LIDAGTIGGLIGLFVGGWSATRRPQRRAEPGDVGDDVDDGPTTRGARSDPCPWARSAIEVVKLEP